MTIESTYSIIRFKEEYDSEKNNKVVIKEKGKALGDSRQTLYYVSVNIKTGEVTAKKIYSEGEK